VKIVCVDSFFRVFLVDFAGSRMMIALEAPTADAVKELIASTQGVDDEREWEQSFQPSGDAGGVVTVLSELGEPIHKVLNRGVQFWREMDLRFFTLPKDAVSTTSGPSLPFISFLNSF
jgi:enoyl reductase-like protein